MRARSERSGIASALSLALLTALVAGIVCGCSSGTPRVAFAGLRQKAVTYDSRSESPNGDFWNAHAYQLHPLDVRRWVRTVGGPHWIRGPVRDARYAKAFMWSRCVDRDEPPNWPYARWLASKDFYFYLEDYKEFTGHEVHHSAIWALDAKSYRLYYVAGRT